MSGTAQIFGYAAENNQVFGLHSYVADGPDAGDNVISMSSLPANSLLVVTMLNPDDNTANATGALSSSPSLTWTKRLDRQTAFQPNLEIWTAEFPAGGDITVTTSWGAGPVSQQTAVCYAFTNAQVGTISGADTNSQAPSITSTIVAGAFTVGAIGNWNVVQGPATYRRAVTETKYSYSPGNSTQYHFYREEPSAGTYEYGISAPFDSGGAYSFGFVEIKSL
jgi:hypothetical protein